MLMELEREHPTLKQSMLKALTNVAPRHLLDRRLNPPEALRRVASRVISEPASAGRPARGGATPSVMPLEFRTSRM
jgi:hypothetical protein